jgi:NAD(P)H-flavin reductase
MLASAETMPSEPGPMVPAPFTVVAKRRDTADTWTLELQPRGDAGRLTFAPGQFTMLSAFGTGEVPISISGGGEGEREEGSPLVHTVRSVGLATKAICDATVGDVLGVRGPFGRPWPVEELASADVLIVAGGIGLAPLRPAILALLGERERYGRLVLLYGGRSPEQLLYAAELREWAERGLDVAVTVDSAGPEWRGHVGVVPRLVRRAELDPARALALLCGPEVMMRFAVAALAQSGVGSDRVYASMERNMQCGIGHCGHCQLGPTLVCRDGPVYRWSELERWLAIREL